ncbi:somatostatin receptor type 5-like isoform X2 [Thalassophryne amazonica]|uniref:somatostatin receptor type 5-like isoform X2 n=1 Tax=Thalassophryne amazonica TaxID=390379 RepID=UPI001472075A|nr:somatostatin receptor type 5-like isoform X2 [Thalassophryne amazonica]
MHYMTWERFSSAHQSSPHAQRRDHQQKRITENYDSAGIKTINTSSPFAFNSTGHQILNITANSWTELAEDANMSTPDFINNTTNFTDLIPGPFIGNSSLLTGVIYIVVFIVGLLGNTLAIYVVLCYTKMKTVTNMFILNLALADELYILGIPFLGTQSVLSYWPYGEFLCKVCMTADAMSQFTSTFCLTVMSVDRYLAVVHPIRSAKWRRPHVVKIFNGTVWVVSFLVVLPVTIYSGMQDGFNSCNLSWPEPQKVWSLAFILYTSILGVFVPLVVICICYLLIIIKVKSAGVRAGVTKRRKSERKVTRMVVIIVLVFVLCWLPFYTTNIVNEVYTIPENDAAAAVYFFLVILTYVNSCANPILYGFLSDNFKQSFQKVLCFHKASCDCVMDKIRRNQAASQDRPETIHNALLTSTNHTQNRNTRNSQCVQMGNLDHELLSTETAVNDQSLRRPCSSLSPALMWTSGTS